MSEPNDGSTTGSEGGSTQPNADLLPKGPYEVQDVAGAPAVPDAPAAEVPAALEAEPPEALDAEAPRPPEVPHATEAAPATAWVTPPGSGRGRRGCYVVIAVVAVLIAAITVLGIAFLIFLGSQVQNILGGTMEFGTGGTECAVTGEATSFPSSTSIRMVAFLEREVAAGETITVAVTYPNGTTESENEVFDTAARCVFQTLTPGLEPGRYVIEYRAGTTVLSHGELTITP